MDIQHPDLHPLYAEHLATLQARADGSYASANDARVLAGLGPSTERPRIRVQWPDGQTEAWADVAIDRYTTLEQGSGTP